MKLKKIYKILSVLIITTMFAGIGYYVINKIVNKKEDGPKELQSTIDDVSKLMLLPSDEVPTLATVTDIKKLEGQAFFARAETGDKILIYTNNKKVILYSPRLNKIIEVGGINLNAGGQQK